MLIDDIKSLILFNFVQLLLKSVVKRFMLLDFEAVFQFTV